MEARLTGRAQDVSQGLVTRDVQGLKLPILAGPSPQCLLSPVTPQAELGLGNWAAICKKVSNHLCLHPLFFWNRHKLTERDENTNPCSATAPPGLGHTPPCLSFPPHQAKHRTGTNVTSTTTTLCSLSCCSQETNPSCHRNPQRGASSFPTRLQPWPSSLPHPAPCLCSASWETRGSLPCGGRQQSD